MPYSFDTELPSVAESYLKTTKAKVTASTLQKNIKENPHYPSLLALAETFDKYKIKNVAYKLESGDLEAFTSEHPLIAFVRMPKKSSDFILVNRITKESVQFLNGKKNELVTKRAFLSRYKEVIWFAEADNNSREENYEENKKQEKNAFYVQTSWKLGIVTLLILIVMGSFPTSNPFGFISIFTLKLIGVIAAILLTSHEFDKNNAFLKNICSARKNTNCDAVLTSNGSKIFGISWAELGFIYFASTILGLLLPNLSYDQKTVWLATANLIVVPYIAYSLYYQAVVVKQWCILCLMVQVVLAGEFIWSILFLYQNSANYLLKPPVILSIIFSVLTPTIIWMGLKKVLIKSNDHDLYMNAYKRLQYNPEIFEKLLQQQPRIPDGWQNLGIDIGNPTAQNIIIKICNPYCTPCDNAHPILEDIIKNNENVGLKVIYITRNNEMDKGMRITKHLLSIANNGERIKTQNALDDWYIHMNKNYEQFLDKYPLKPNLDSERSMITLMANWCDLAEVSHTPTIFINGHRLPENYELDELKFILRRFSLSTREKGDAENLL